MSYYLNICILAHRNIGGNMFMQTSRTTKWKRSRNGWLAGVCEGLGESFEVKPNIIRVLWLISLFFFGTGILAYIILALTLPREDRLYEYQEDKLFGVCKRISEQSGLELPLVRTLAVVSFIASLGTSILLYLILNFVLPENEDKISY